MFVVKSFSTRPVSMKLEHVRQFVLVVDTGSFTRAADYCGIPKSTISRCISTLEKDLGTRLLQRTTRKLTMTEAGELFYQRALEILEQIEETEREISEGQSDVKGKLVLYVPTLILDKCRQHVADFASSYPNCHLELHSTALGQRAVLDKRFDLLVYIGEPFDSSFIARPLADMGYDYFASPEYLEEHGVPEKPEDLFSHRCIYRSRNAQDAVAWQFGEEELAIKPDITCDSPYMTHAFLLQGIGIGQLPLILAAKSVAEKRLVRLFDGRYAFRQSVYGMYSSRRFLPQKVETLIESIKSKLPGEVAALESVFD